MHHLSITKMEKQTHWRREDKVADVICSNSASKMYLKYKIIFILTTSKTISYFTWYNL